MTTSFLEEAIEDAIFSMSEQNWLIPSTIPVWYSEEEYSNIERFHRLRVRKDGKLGILNDRYPFIRLSILGININIFPEIPPAPETIH